LEVYYKIRDISVGAEIVLLKTWIPSTKGRSKWHKEGRPIKLYSKVLARCKSVAKAIEKLERKAGRRKKVVVTSVWTTKIGSRIQGKKWKRYGEPQ
jgi:hypothetical protein